MTKPKLSVKTKAAPRVFQIQQTSNEASITLEERTKPGTDGYKGELSDKLLDSFRDIRDSVYLEWL